jgi:hypothetical protein
MQKGNGMMRYLVIAARNHSNIHGYLHRQFAGDEAVQVFLDRRHAERRQRQDSCKAQRRRGERRRGRGRESDLETHGFVIVRQAAGLQWRPPWWSTGTPRKLGEFDRRLDAKHLARLIIGAIVLFHKDRIPEAIKNDALFEVLARELEEGRRYYEKNVDQPVGAEVDYFDQAIVDVLVKEQGIVTSKIW